MLYIQLIPCNDAIVRMIFNSPSSHLLFSLPNAAPNDTQTPYYERKVLNEWFQHYDSDGNGCIELNHTEEITFHDHIHIFTSCAQFLDHISEVIDVDDSGSITHTEWMTFFTNGE